MPKTAGGLKAEAALFRALAHPVRLQIMEILAGQESCVCHLTAALGRRQPYISQQLGILREAGLVADRREGTLIFYRLADEGLASLLTGGRSVAQALGGQELEFPPLPEGPVVGCPCPHCQA